MTYVKTNTPGYFKDPKTGFIVNRNDADFKMYETQKQLYKEKLKTESELKSALNSIDELKKQMEEFKQLILEKRTENNG